MKNINCPTVFFSVRFGHPVRQGHCFCHCNTKQRFRPNFAKCATFLIQKHEPKLSFTASICISSTSTLDCEIMWMVLLLNISQIVFDTNQVDKAYELIHKK